jgi:hypothetical protein
LKASPGAMAARAGAMAAEVENTSAPKTPAAKLGLLEIMDKLIDHDGRKSCGMARTFLFCAGVVMGWGGGKIVTVVEAAQAGAVANGCAAPEQAASPCDLARDFAARKSVRPVL